MSMKTKVGIIGTGGISEFHMNGYQALSDMVEVTAVCDIDEAKVKAYAARHNVPRWYTDYNEMMAKEELDAVSVTTWNSAHCGAAVAALNGGANVICEKPMAMNRVEAETMRQAAVKNGRVLQIGFVRRFGMDALAAKSFIDSGRAGDIYYAKVSYLRRNGCPGGWFADKEYAGGGPLIDLGVHVMDLARWLAGRPKPVAASGVTFSTIGHRRAGGVKAWETDGSGYKADVEDFASALIRFDNGFVLSVEASFNLNIQGDRGDVEIFGSKAGIKLGNPSQYFGVDGVDGCIDDPAFAKPSDFGSIFRYEIAHFVDCVRNGVECRAPAEDGVILMKMIDAVYESAYTGKEVLIL